MEPNIHVSRNQVTLGTFSEAQIKGGLAQGAITPNDYCWTQGMDGWKTIAEAYPHLLPSGSAPIPSGQNQPESQYPSGGERFGAYLLDGLFMGLMTCGMFIPLFIVIFALAEESNSRDVGNVIGSIAQIFGSIVGLGISILYHGIQGNSAHNATWGQRIMGFKMVDSKTGAAPHSGQVWKWSAFRSLILGCCSCIGWLFFIPILNNPRKQSSFDDWADILMVKK
jgi:uncharacterized RDD family membrane protein YckC